MLHCNIIELTAQVILFLRCASSNENAKNLCQMGMKRG